MLGGVVRPYQSRQRVLSFLSEKCQSGGTRKIGLGSVGKQSVEFARARELTQEAHDDVLDGKGPAVVNPHLLLTNPEWFIHCLNVSIYILPPPNSNRRAQR